MLFLSKEWRKVSNRKLFLFMVGEERGGRGVGTAHLPNRQPTHLNTGNLKQTLGESVSKDCFFCCFFYEGLSACKSYPWEKEHSILVRIFGLQHHSVFFQLFWDTLYFYLLHKVHKIGVVYISGNHFWRSQETPPPLCNIVIIWASPPCNTVIILPFPPM